MKIPGLARTKTFVSGLVNFGVTESTPPELAKRMRLTNGISVFLGSTAIPYIPIHLIAGSFDWVINNFYFLAYFGAILALNRFKLPTFARYMLLLGITVAVLAVAYDFGRDNQTHLFFLGMIGLPFMLFELRQKFSILGITALFTALFLIIENKNIHLFDGHPGHAAASGGSVGQILSVFFLMIGIIWHFRAENERSEKNLRQALLDVQEKQERMIQSSKMSALGEMAGGIAHEINNPLSVIQLRSEYVRSLVQKGQFQTDKGLEAVAGILETVDRISRIVKGLRAFAREGGSDPMIWIDAQQLIQDALSLSQERFRVNGIEIRTEIDPRILLRCRPVEALQILLNLMNNSFDAVQGQPEKWIRISACEDEGSTLIEVADSGAGVHPAVRNKIFQPFFTTKPVGQGTGLGLSISKGLAERQGGELSFVESAQATTFRVRFEGRLGETGVNPLRLDLSPAQGDIHLPLSQS